MNDWVKMPTKWLQDKNTLPLRNFTWDRDNKSNNTAALMIYIIIIQQAQNSGKAKLSYSSLCDISSLSRAKVAAGLEILERKKLLIIDRAQKTNIYNVVDYDRAGWGKLPAKHLYDINLEYIKQFQEFNLRRRVELDALKLFLVLVAFRDEKKNHATISYEKISLYTGIPEAKIRSAISLLVSHDMIHVQKYGDTMELWKRANFYRIIGVNNKKHAGNMTIDKLMEVN